MKHSVYGYTFAFHCFYGFLNSSYSFLCFGVTQRIVFLCSLYYPLQIFLFVFLFPTNIPFCLLCIHCVYVPFFIVLSLFCLHGSMGKHAFVSLFLKKSWETRYSLLNILSMCTCLVTNDGFTFWWMVFK